MRNMSFSKTEDQILNKTKTVTRRLGWEFLRPGDMVQPVRKCRGLKKGEKGKPLCAPIRILSVRREPLNIITTKECQLEGFTEPGMTPEEFVDMFCKLNRCVQDDFITRIEFEYL